jgi:hypothetical protein
VNPRIFSEKFTSLALGASVLGRAPVLLAGQESKPASSTSAVPFQLPVILWTVFTSMPKARARDWRNRLRKCLPQAGRSKVRRHARDGIQDDRRPGDQAPCRPRNGDGRSRHDLRLASRRFSGAEVTTQFLRKVNRFEFNDTEAKCLDEIFCGSATRLRTSTGLLREIIRLRVRTIP